MQHVQPADGLEQLEEWWRRQTGRGNRDTCSLQIAFKRNSGRRLWPAEPRRRERPLLR